MNEHQQKRGRGILIASPSPDHDRTRPGHRHRRQNALARAAAFSATIALVAAPPSTAAAAPTSVYNGSAFTSAPAAPTTAGGTSVSRAGAYTYSFPIEVPPGRLGVQPALALTYRSDGPNFGTIAAGWSLDLPSIALDTSKGILQSERRWLTGLAGGEPLIPSHDPRGPNVEATFRARYDISNARYEQMTTSAPFQWQVRTPDGMIHRFGRRLGDAPVDKLALLAETVDAHGNTVSYEWAWDTFGRGDGGIAWSPRLERILYTSNPNAGLPPFARVEFTYDSSSFCNGGLLSVGSQLSNRAGLSIITGHDRLVNITTFTTDRAAANGAVRSYDLLYDAEQASCNRDGGPRRRLLEIRVKGWSPAGQILQKAPISFGYEPDQPHYHEEWQLGSRESGSLHHEIRAGASPAVFTMLVDIDGDALPDHVVAEGGEDCGFYWQKNLGYGFEEARRHVRRPHLPYGDVPDDWREQAGPASVDPAQWCSLNAQRTLYENVDVNLDDICESGGHHVRTPSLVNWRFLDVNLDGLVDMVAAIDANVAGLDPAAVQFEGVTWRHNVTSRRSKGSFVAEIRALQDKAASDLTEACVERRPFAIGDRYPWIVFRNEGYGTFAATPEVIEMPVPLVASTASGRTAVGSQQVGSAFGDVFHPDSFQAGAAWKQADPFAFADIDGDGIQDIISSFKSDEEIAGGEPVMQWNVLRGLSDGLFEGKGGSEQPYAFGAVPGSHANGVTISGVSLLTTSTGASYDRRFSGVASGLFELNGDGLPEFLWTKLVSQDGDLVDWQTIGYGHSNLGDRFRNCETPHKCAVTFSSMRSIGSGAVYNLASRHSLDIRDDQYNVNEGSTWTDNAWIDVDGDGRQDLVSGVSNPYLPAWKRVRYSDGEQLLEPRDLPYPIGLGVHQVEDGLSWFSSDASRMLLDIDGDGRLDAMLRHGGSNDQDDDGVLDGTTVDDSGDLRTWSVFRSAHRPVGLLTRIDNGHGGSTHIEYASVRDQWVVRDWKLPVHAWVVSAMSSDSGDGAPAQVTRYEYGDAAWNLDADGRWGYRGFGFMAVTSPTGARSESRVDYSFFHAGLPGQTATFELVGGTYRPRSVATHVWDAIPSEWGALFVQAQSDEYTCSAADATVAQCLGGEVLRNTSSWKWYELAGDSTPLLLPQEDFAVAGTDVQAIGALSTRRAYESIVTGTDLRVRVRSTAGLQKTAAGWREIQFQETIHDPTLKRVIESRVKLDDTRVARTRFGYNETVGVVETIESPESVAGGSGYVASTQYDAHFVNVVRTVNELGHLVEKVHDLGTGAVLVSSGPQYRCPIIALFAHPGDGSSGYRHEA